MITLLTRSKDAIVGIYAAGVQGRFPKFLNFSIGSVLLAVAEATTAVALWLQAEMLKILKVTRLATSFGDDADSFIADYGIIERLGAQAATGLVIFERFTAGPSQVVIPVGAQVRTLDGTQTFEVYALTSHPAYSVALGGYVMAAAVATVTAPVRALEAGSVGNVETGTISRLVSSLVGVDSVTNPSSFTNGFDQEEDEPLKARFRLAIAGLARGNYYGTSYALGATSLTIEWSLIENENLDGSWHPGFYIIVADDGSGAPPDDFLAAVAVAADAVRPLGNQLAVIGPTLLLANVSMQITTAAGFDHNTVVAQVGNFVGTNIGALGLGNGLPYSILAAWAYSIPGVVAVSNVLLNGGTADIAPNKKRTLNAGIMVVS